MFLVLLTIAILLVTIGFWKTFKVLVIFGLLVIAGILAIVGLVVMVGGLPGSC